jgi:sterol desaturase/sphingolipid hydroxylase (fatty acid hydroxylase superfamily)
MNGIIEYFSSDHEIHRILLLSATFLFFGFMEALAPITLDYKKSEHFLRNGLFIFTATPIQFLFGIVITKLTLFESIHQLGLFHQFDLNPLWLFILSLIALDFFEYVYHIIMHKVKRLWMFHVVHHSDEVVNISTTLREHPGETFIRLIFTILWIGLLGVNFWIVILRQCIQVISNILFHANIRIPEKLNNVLSLIFITPNMHHVHHHFSQPYTNKNYGDILSVWDRLFGTFAKLSAKETVFGVDTFNEVGLKTKFNRLLAIPFGKYRKPLN